MCSGWLPKRDEIRTHAKKREVEVERMIKLPPVREPAAAHVDNDDDDDDGTNEWDIFFPGAAQTVARRIIRILSSPRESSERADDEEEDDDVHELVRPSRPFMFFLCASQVRILLPR